VVAVATQVADAKGRKTRLSTASLIESMGQTGRMASHQVGFTYDNHGSDWTGTCSTGQLQSPISLSRANITCRTNAHERQGHDLSLSYRYVRRYSNPVNGNITTRNDGSTVLLEGDFGFALSGSCHCDTISEENRYIFKSIRFHSPSEHQWEGKNYPLEAQLVHQKAGSTDNNDLLIVVVPFSLKFTPGGNKFLYSLGWDTLLPKSGATYVIPSPNLVDLNHLQYSLTGDFWAYRGSLSTPGCDETVKWRVMERPLGASQAQFDQFKQLFPNGNNRQVQNLNGRHLFFYES